MTFYEWIETQQEREDNIGSLANNILNDTDFPADMMHPSLLFNYLELSGKVLPEDINMVMSAALRAWQEYEFHLFVTKKMLVRNPDGDIEIAYISPVTTMSSDDISKWAERKTYLQYTLGFEKNLAEFTALIHIAKCEMCSNADKCEHKECMMNEDPIYSNTPPDGSPEALRKNFKNVKKEENENDKD